MNNLYHKVAVASACTALGFALGANEEAKAAAFYYFNYDSLGSELTFHAIDGDGSYGSVDGLGDTVTNVSYNNHPGAVSHSWFATEKTDAREVAALLEFSFSSLTRSITASYGENAKVKSITNALLGIGATAGINNFGIMGAFGYVGNGIPEASDFEAGVFLDSKVIYEYPDWYYFNVTSFVKELLRNNNEFGGFELRSLDQSSLRLLSNEYGPVRVFPPLLILSGEIELGMEPEPVPEPTTIFGSALALGIGGWLKRKKSSQRDETVPQR